MLRRAVPLILLAIANPFGALAYDDRTTHPALTDEIIDFYNLSSPQIPISPEEKEWIVEGSMLEDHPPRWINHFYDPISKAGWSGENTGRVPSGLAMLFSWVTLSPEEPLSAVAWLNAYLVQDEYEPYGGNRSWKRGMEHYSVGDRREAFLTLGHALHLLEDMAVPDHTRDDTHAHALNAVTGDPGSPYESYASRWNRQTIKELGLARSLAAEGRAPIALPEAAEYLESMALYSNNYFFSRDTINSSRYRNPQVTETDENFGYGLDENGNKFPLARVHLQKSNGKIGSSYTLNDVRETEILNHYFSRLSRQAILHGAGLVNLFIKQGEDAKVNKDFPQHLVKLEVTKLIPPVFSMAGISYRLRNFTERSVSSALATMQGLARKVAGVFEGEPEPVPSPEVTPQFAASPDKQSEPEPDPENAPPAVPEPEDDLAYEARLREEIARAEAELARLQDLLAKKQEEEEVSIEEEQPEEPVIAKATSSIPSPTSSSVPYSGGVLASAASTSAEPGRVVISEIQVAGADAGDEFIELHNAGSSPVDLSGWSIQYKSGTSGSVSKKNFESGNMIAPKGFFLIGRGLNGSGADGYAGSADLRHRTFALSAAASGATILLVNDNQPVSGADDTSIVDRVAYGSGSHLLAEGQAAPVPGANQSIERKSFSCGTGEFEGNGCDTGNNLADFSLRSTAFGQSSQNLPEPRSAPSVNGLAAAYSASSLWLDLTWQPSADSVGATSTNSYEIWLAEGASSTLLFQSSTFAYRHSVPEIGRSYAFDFVARDRDGLSASTTLDASVPALLTRLNFYPESRPGYADRYVLDMSFTSSTFIPQVWSSGNPEWQAMVFYLNRDPNPANSQLIPANSYDPSDKEGAIRVQAVQCAGGGETSRFHYPFALVLERCGSGGGLNNTASPVLPPEDRRLILGTTSSTADLALGSSDYVTVAFYDYYAFGDRFELVARDRTRYYFQSSTPAQTAPTAPGNFAESSFDESSSKLSLTWSASTDADSPDALITYELNISTSTEFASSGWLPAGTSYATSVTVSYGSSYVLGIRAVDDFGVASDPAVLAWTWSGLPPLPGQTERPNFLSVAGAGRGQKITFAASTTLTGVAMWAGPDTGVYLEAQSYLEIMRDDGGAFGASVATSSVVQVTNAIGPQEVMYEFSGLTLDAGSYWLVSRVDPGFTGADTKIFGITDDRYADGYWSTSLTHDAYFRLRR